MDSTTAVEIDLSTFTLDEIDEIERLSDIPLPMWFDGQTREGGLRRAIAYVVARRTDPAATLATAGQMEMKVR